MSIKIYCLPIPDHFRPSSQTFKYPRHNRDYGVEQDFFEFLQRNPAYVTSNPQEADWHYLPIYWTRWHLNHNYAKDGLDELQTEVSRQLIDDQKTFLICQYDDGPVINTGDTLHFLASRKTEKGYDIPLLCAPHRLPWWYISKKYTATFIGRVSTHPCRKELQNLIGEMSDIFFFDGDIGTRKYVRRVLASNLALAPRGYGGSSFRFFEAMALGVTPVLIGDLDTRPFRDYLRWDECSYYLDSPSKVLSLLKTETQQDSIAKGKLAKTIYRQELSYQKWCKWVIKILGDKR